MPQRTLKRHLLIGTLLSVYVVAYATGCFTFRTSDGAQRTRLLRKGVYAPWWRTAHLLAPDGSRYLHAVGVHPDSTLPVVMFIHGSPGSSDAFQRYLADTTLLRRAQIVSIDRPGFGYSGYGRGETYLSQQAALLQPIIRHYAASGQPLILVGHSLGGPLAVQLALDYPQQVSALLLLAASVDPDLEPHEWFRPMLAVWGIRHLLPGSIRASNTELLGARASLLQLLPRWSQLKQPVWVVQGDRDMFVPAANADFVERRAVAAAQIHITRLQGVNHFIPWTHYSVVLQQLHQILDKVYNRPPSQ